MPTEHLLNSNLKKLFALALSVLSLVLFGCGGSKSQSAASVQAQPAPGATAPSITSQPSSQTVTAGQTVAFSVTATGTAPLSYQWQKNQANIAGATAAAYAIASAATTDSGSYDVTVTNSAGTVTSNAATLTVNSSTSIPTPPAPTGTDVTTYHNDLARTGQNLTETTLTMANVNSQTFGLLRNLQLDGKVDAEPLYLSQLSFSGVTHNTLFVATENDSVYAFDADTGAKLWMTSLLGAGETTSDPHGCSQVTPSIGITSTPVIDRSAGPHGIIYVVAMSQNGAAYYQRLHALDVTTGAELLGGPVVIQATYPGSGPNSSGGQLVFNPYQYEERAGLLLLNGVIYTAWTSHCDQDPYNGWIIAYSESSLSQTAVLNLTPNGSEGSIWQSGDGLAADGQGNIFVLMANGTFDTTLDSNNFPVNRDYGNAFVRIATSGGLQVADYFTMFNTVAESGSDVDLGSGGTVLLPPFTNGSITVNLAVGAGKDGNIYIVDRTNMGKFNPADNSNVYQELPGALPNGVWGVPAYFNGNVYYCDVSDTLKSFAISNGKLSGTPLQTSASFTSPGLLPSISANGTSNGIVWGIENTSPAVLHAFSAANIAQELYNSNQAANGRDQFGAGNKFVTPMIADGKVFAATTNSVAVFGLLP